MSTHSQVRVRSSLARSAATLASMALPQHQTLFSVQSNFHAVPRARVVRAGAHRGHLGVHGPAKRHNTLCEPTIPVWVALPHSPGAQQVRAGAHRGHLSNRGSQCLQAPKTYSLMPEASVKQQKVLGLLTPTYAPCPCSQEATPCAHGQLRGCQLRAALQQFLDARSGLHLWHTQRLISRA